MNYPYNPLIIAPVPLFPQIHQNHSPFTKVNKNTEGHKHFTILQSFCMHIFWFTVQLLYSGQFYYLHQDKLHDPIKTERWFSS